MPSNDKPDKMGHIWETSKTASGKRVKACKICLYVYSYGYDLPCPGVKKK